MASKIRQHISALRISVMVCLVGIAASVAVAQRLGMGISGYSPPQYRAGAPQPVSADDLDIHVEISEESCEALVEAHKNAIACLMKTLDERDRFGSPTVRSHLAAKTLVALEHRGVLPFLVRNLDYSIPLPFAFNVEPVVEGRPYILPLIESHETGARAVVDVVARSPQESVTEREWLLYGYVLVCVFGHDEKGREAAIALIDQRDPERTNPMLSRLRESVRAVKRPLVR